MADFQSIIDALLGRQATAPAPAQSAPINPNWSALLDNSLYPHEPGYTRFDRYREDEPGMQEWARRGAANGPWEGNGTAPAIPPSFLPNGANADRRGEIPDPQWFREWMRAKNLDIQKI